MEKNELLKKFREEADTYLEKTTSSTKDKKKQASYINKKVTELRNTYTDAILITDDSSAKKLDNILLTAYVSYIVMLEYRNKVWKYDYMAFSRRIGEMWEPFCKIPFSYPVKDLDIYDPPSFKSVQLALETEIKEYINTLEIGDNKKSELLEYYNRQSLLIGSGSISLDLDLHFTQNNIYYNVDYKSGFNSNEKGNTNRLLMVASIYKGLSTKNKTLLFVRQPEAENNHYLQTLKNSSLWEVYTSDDTYNKIHEFTGFDLKSWMTAHMNWAEDISPEFKEYLIENDLSKYLTW
ncbi:MULTISPECIES: hypothetical protein [Bacilli]|uniref:hypothetical protein n=1 Tax=Bacilli TaxID=91061 RepID=UPI0008A2C45D|nr:hypothetical protein [Staphylococcus sp. HMSC072E01]OFQ11548.1 hypothetical protein HMPREF2953_07745 [Staphylococcus sp. HMSC072E01]